MRVLYDDSLARNPAGTGTFVRGLGDALARRDDLELVRPVGNLAGTGEVDIGSKRIAGRIRNAAQHLAYYARDLPAQARLERCDAIFSPSSLGPLRGQTPSFITLFDVSPLAFAGTMDPISRQYIRAMIALGVRRSAGICTISEAVAGEIRQRFPQVRNLAVAYPGPNPGLIEADPVAAPIPNAPFLLMVGTLEPRKNHITALRALADHLRRRPASEMRLVLAGSAGWQYAPLLQAIDELGVRSRVSLLGKIDPGVLRWLYEHAGALLFPSLYEGFGLPVLEAFCLGCPVIGAAIPSVAEVAGDAAPLLAPTDVAAWSAAIDSVEANRAADSLVAAGKARARRFTWAACGDAVANLLSTGAKPA